MYSKDFVKEKDISKELHDFIMENSEAVANYESFRNKDSVFVDDTFLFQVEERLWIKIRIIE